MFHGSQNYPYVPIDSILQKYNQEWLFLKYTGIYPEFSKKYPSIFRSDRTPGCRFEWRSGVLYFIDNAGYNGQLYFNIIHTICILNRISVPKAINMIETENVVNYNIPTSAFSVKSRPDIRFKYVTWPENNYFGIKPFDLENENVYLVTDYWIKESDQWLHNHIHNPKKSLTIAYYFPETNNTKLYWPLEDKFRWYTNCVNEIYGESKIDYYLEKNPDLIIITKSQKDRLILDYYNDINAIAPQSETSAISEKVIRKCKQFNRCLILYDNDLPGQLNASKLSFKTGFEWTMFPLGKDAFDNRNNNLLTQII